MAPTHNRDSSAQAPARWPGLTFGVLLGVLIVGAWRACSHTHARRRSQRSAAVPAPIQDWDNEGGTSEPRAD